jgi:hypothetical protein
VALIQVLRRGFLYQNSFPTPGGAGGHLGSGQASTWYCEEAVINARMVTYNFSDVDNAQIIFGCVCFLDRMGTAQTTQRSRSMDAVKQDLSRKKYKLEWWMRIYVLHIYCGDLQIFGLPQSLKTPSKV